MDNTTLEPTISADEQADPFSQPWHEAGALVIRQQDLDAGRWVFASDELSPSDVLDPAVIDEGFAALIKRYAQRRGHLALGFVFELAEAWGLEVEGSYALCSAADPNLIIWPRSSATYLANLVYILQHDPETLHSHEAQIKEAEAGCISPTLSPVDTKLYNNREPQDEPRWLPAVLCARLEGIGTKVGPGPDAQIEGVSSILASLMAAGLGDAVTIVATDEDGNQVKSASLAQIMAGDYPTTPDAPDFDA